MSLNEKSDPFLKANGRKSWYIRSLVMPLLNKMVLTLEVSVHSGYRSVLVVENKLPRIPLMGEFNIFIVFGHFVRGDDDAVSWLVVFDLPVNQSVITYAKFQTSESRRTICTARPRKNCPNLRVGCPSSSKSWPHIFSNVVSSFPVDNLEGPLGRLYSFSLASLS